MWGTSYVREMGHDTRSVIRAVLYAAMLDNHSIVKTSGNLNDCCQVIDCLSSQLINQSINQNRFI